MRPHPIWGTILFMYGLMWRDIGLYLDAHHGSWGPYVIAAICISAAITVFPGKR